VASGAPADPTGGGARSAGLSPSSAPERELRELRRQLRSGNADLYRHLALYLQVLRQVLPVRVERATFHLATQIQPQRYAALPAEERHQLHRRLHHLVHRCSSLLTVEQLCSLASQMARERQRQERRQRRLLLQRFSADAPRPTGQGGAQTQEPKSPAPLPEGSVDLDGSASFSGGVLAVLPRHGLPRHGRPRWPGNVFGNGRESPSSAEAVESADAGDPEAGSQTEHTDEPADTGEAAQLRAALESFAAAQFLDAADAAPDGEPEEQKHAHEAMDGHSLADGPVESEEDDPFSPHPELADSPPLSPLLKSWIAEAPSMHPPSPLSPARTVLDPWCAGDLPDHPQRLLRWLEGVERALARRLRNLSHAINVELLRVGLCGSLLPVSLLDAVLDGQIEAQPAPPNLLRLQLPFPSDDASSLQVTVLLLRSVDLELEEPRLRTCRRRLQQHRQEVRRMAQQFRRLQRRREAQEAEQLWLQDRQASLSPPG
jgi:hypothetical protein